MRSRSDYLSIYRCKKAIMPESSKATIYKYERDKLCVQNSLPKVLKVVQVSATAKISI